MSRFFPDDQNIEWTYNNSDLKLSIQSFRKVKGVNIDRKLNHFTKDYSLI